MVAAPEPTRERAPFFLHCGKCSEEWIAAWTPATVEAWAGEVARNSTCPRCGAIGAALCGKSPKIEGKARG